ncbi:MBL fold metallo-hydrolase [Streptomyces smyrnaeus]|uniref:MBL fold metallo-hydrolase n=1 Tax=Streptomyces TaxID=1883 RepID=UPI000C180FBD|nr:MULTISPECIES: MBL fold metallo-hydrolase [unclassified Streptomyces]MBQ0863468.1 MBL fold metallo-hydrolase [Streptomyces sp. RK75]MBQ1120905.1 MBL fold metallo-hydrolase [Streptomyces sp. B15]MBQ1156966.1 MBL fold metallo-hydrolase [Streptomyces sp. A73]
MEPQTVRPQLHMIPFPVGQAFLWQDGEAVTLVDTGPPGGADAVEAAIRHCGAEPAALRRIVLTHFHPDHAGSAAELAARHGAQVVAHRADAAVIRGEAPSPPPDMAAAPAWERAVFDHVHAPFGITAEAPEIPLAPPCRVDQEVAEGDVLEFGGGATVLSVPGHTEGSIALLLPEHRTLFTGDTAARTEDGPAPGVFNQDRARTETAFLRLCALGAQEAVETVCFGHGAPLATGGGETLAQAAARYS